MYQGDDGGDLICMLGRAFMTIDTITRITLGDVSHRKHESRTDWERLRREDATGIEPEKDPYEGKFDWSRAQVTMPRPK